MKPDRATPRKEPGELRAGSIDPSSQRLRILIADDHALIRQGLRQVLLDYFKDSQIAEAGNAKEALDFIVRQDWDAILLDITMPGQNGLDVLKQAKQILPKTPVLVLSMHPEDQYAMRALKAGASGYLTKNTASELVIGALDKVLKGGTYISAALAEELAQRITDPVAKSSHETLSDREYQIMSALAAGKTVKEVSFELGLSVKTVSTYRTRLLRKLKLSTTAELIRYALREGLVD